MEQEGLLFLSSSKGSGISKALLFIRWGEKDGCGWVVYCHCHSGEKEKWDIRKFRSQKEPRMRWMDRCNKRKWLVLRDLLLCKFKRSEKLFNDLLAFWRCDHFTEMSIYELSFRLNITKMQSTSPRLLIVYYSILKAAWEEWSLVNYLCWGIFKLGFVRR